MFHPHPRPLPSRERVFRIATGVAAGFVSQRGVEPDKKGGVPLKKYAPWCYTTGLDYNHSFSRLAMPLFQVELDTELRNNCTLPHCLQVPWLVGPLGVSISQKWTHSSMEGRFVWEIPVAWERIPFPSELWN